MSVRKLRRFSQVGHLHHGIGGGLHKEGLRFRPDGSLDLLKIRGVHRRERKTVLRIDMVKQAVRAAVQIIGTNNVVTGGKQLHDRGNRRHAGRERQRLFALLEPGHSLLQVLSSRVLHP